ncbi:M23 family metallopeptidase [Paenibacillus lutrae]|uniref:Peptidoglycan DD-metalloendopeptidase family protein n=1 Tax=Paenibacillus lutrae TaxID=2078573 RepID=A0A7X3FKY1_9BACL|nr:M23 family metallopeptidase [Paenibacillus lutrae]MVP01518.1 peptidoglycan DD-metalloendopeptidase family protein [Paenibacillus lutrae]
MRDGKQEFQKKEDAPQTAMGAANVPNSAWKRFLAKKWVFPATYVAAAAIILTIMWVYQDAMEKPVAIDTPANVQSDKPAGETAGKDNAVAVGAKAESMQWPVKDRSQVTVTLPSYDSKASNEAKQAAMVEYGDTLTPHVGIDLARSDKQAFEVSAALSGKVTAVDKNPVVGNLVEITHENGLVTVYQSLGDVKVAAGATVKQGEIIAQAGRNELEKDQGVHLHFEVRKGEAGAVELPEQLLPEFKQQ